MKPHFLTPTRLVFTCPKTPAISRKPCDFAQVDPYARPLTDAQLLEEYTKLQTAERECINEIRDADRKAKDILKKREEEESDIIESEEESAALLQGSRPPVPAHLAVTVYDTTRSKLATQEEPDENTASQVSGSSKAWHDAAREQLPG